MLRLDLASRPLLVHYSLARNGFTNVILARDLFGRIRRPRLAGGVVIDGVGGGGRGRGGRPCAGLEGRLMDQRGSQARV